MAIFIEDKNITRYLCDIGDRKPLSAQKERELAKRIQQGDMKARDELVCANLCFVVSIAKQYQNNGVLLSDLISEGNVGLITAAEKFDASKGFKFVTYAIWWVRQAILQALCEQTRVIRMPGNQISALIKIHQTATYLWQKLGSEPTAEQIAAELCVEIEEVRSAFASAKKVLSLDAPLTEGDEERSLYDKVKDTSVPAPDANLMAQSIQDQIEIMMSQLKEREAEVIKLYFGLKGRARLTLKQIGDVLGCGKEAVRQTRDIALRKLRKWKLRNMRIVEYD